MALEAIADKDITDYYDFQMTLSENGTLQLDFRNTIEAIIEDIRKGDKTSVISAKFHNFVAQAMLDFACRARKKFDLHTVALSGGVFCNRYLTNRLIQVLKKNNFLVLFKKELPANDGGIALGQAAIAVAALGNANDE